MNGCLVAALHQPIAYEQIANRRAPPTLAPWQQEQAATLIRSVRERLLAEDPDIAADPELWHDTLDG